MRKPPVQYGILQDQQYRRLLGLAFKDLLIMIFQEWYDLWAMDFVLLLFLFFLSKVPRLIVVYLVWIFRGSFPCYRVWTCTIENFCRSGLYVSCWSCCILYIHDSCRRRWSESNQTKIQGCTDSPSPHFGQNWWKGYIPTLKANYCIWPAVQIINFKFMPLPLQIPFVNTVGVFWYHLHRSVLDN